MGWNDFIGRAMTRAQFAAYVASLTWSAWKPIGIVLHNTAAPTLAQWAEIGPAHEARIRNLKNYYQNQQHWHGGPHLFVSRDFINVFDGLLEPGTHSPSFNRTHFGIEMVGDFDRELFNSGDGAKVRDNAVFAMAVLCLKHGFNPDTAIKLHKEDPRTTHACPGKYVVKADVIARVKAEMLRQSGKPALVIPDKVDGPPSPPPTWKVPDHDAFKDDKPKPRRYTNITATVFSGPGDKLDNSLSAYGGRVDHNAFGVALPFKFQGKRRKVRVFHKGRSEIASIVDRGPHNLNDDYWNTAAGRPRVEAQYIAGARSENGKVPRNDAGIDLTPGLARAIGLVGKGKVDWEFVQPSGGGNVIGGGAGVIIVGGGTVAANEAQKAGWHPVAIGMIFVSAVVLAVAAWTIIKRMRA